MTSRILMALHDEIFNGPLETAGFFLGIANIVLLVRRSIWNYPVGLVMVALLSYVFFEAHLYSDALLQVFFFAVQIVGWVAWSRNKSADGELVVTSARTQELALVLAATAAGAVALGWLMQHYTPAAYPYWDATVASASVFAQIMLTMRRVENWLWWMGANVISIAIYPRKGLFMLAALYVFFLVMSALGYREWLGKLRLQRQTPLPGAVGTAAA